MSPGRAQLAERWVAETRTGSVDAWYLDLHAASVARQALGSTSDRLSVVGSPDLPEHSYQWIGFPVLTHGEAELTRDLLQQACQRLDQGGTLAVAVDNPRDTWLHEQMRALFSSVKCVRTESGSIYSARKSGPLKRVRDFTCEFVFRDQERLIKVISEPGVFSHRRLDAGARQLMNACEIEEEDQVMDLGCGSGGVALAAAFQTSREVWAVDSNTRAVRCAARGAELNGLANVRTLINADGRLGMDNSFELVLANPPYFGDHKISQHFVDTGLACLRPGGALIVVAKRGAWFESYFDLQELDDIVAFQSGEYQVVCGRKT